MVNKELVEKVNQLGVPLMTPQENVDVNQTIAEVVKSHDTRLWENFAPLLANTAPNYEVDLKKVQDQLNAVVDQKAFQKLLALTKVLAEHYHVMQPALKKTFDKFSGLSTEVQKHFEELRNAVMHSSSVEVAELNLSTDRLRHSFEDYLVRMSLQEKDDLSKHEDLSLEFAFSQLFTQKQKELFRKKLNGEKLTKTEREYFSRAVKRKVQALANPDLHRLAQKLLG
jgi:hypothetical protein